MKRLLIVLVLLAGCSQEVKPDPVVFTDRQREYIVEFLKRSLLALETERMLSDYGGVSWGYGRLP